MSAEIEIKLEVSAAQARKFVKSAWLKKLSAEPAKREHLVSVYFDTQDFVVRKSDAILRVRTIGNNHVQTLKANSCEDGPFGRFEWETDLDSPKPDLRKLPKKHSAGRHLRKHRNELKPIFETDVSRVTIPVRYRGSELEVAVDTGQIRTGRHRLPIHEIEVELKNGSRASVVAFAAEICGQVHAAYGALSKAERGYALRRGMVGSAVSAQDIPLSTEMTTADAFQSIALSCVHHFAANYASVVAQDAEGLHQMRVGLRRLRAALSIFKEMLRGKETETVKRELKWLTEELGPARDMDVLSKGAIESIKVRSPVKKSAIAALKADIRGQRTDGFERATAAVKSDRYRKLTLNTVFWLAGGRWTKTQTGLIADRRRRAVVDFARIELKRRTEKVLKKLGKLDEIDANRRHKLRIAIKKLRYGTGYFEALFRTHKAKSRRKCFEGVLGKLQSSLGNLNDIQVHGQLADTYATPESARTGKTPKAYAMGLLVGEERGGADDFIADAMRSRKDLADTKPFWT